MQLDPLLLRRLNTLRFERLLVLSGAGISAESGIPTYRGEGGLWRRLDFEKLATHAAFDADPRAIWNWYQERRDGVRLAEPNDAHLAVARLAAAAREALVITQNVDDLHERAGLASEHLVHIHGEILKTRCEACGLVSAARATDGRTGCRRCRAHAERPNVVWFDEELPQPELRRIERFLAAGACDLVIVVGTTASFDYVQDWIARAAGARGLVIDVNPEKSEVSQRFPERGWHVRGRAGDVLPAIERALSWTDP